MVKLNIYMKRYLSTLKKNAGFTLIELLVVIGILGILAAALVATIDPFEQLKKAQDTTTTNVLTEWINGTTRYYTTRMAFPWEAGGASCNGAADPAGNYLNEAGMIACTAALIGDNELKSAFSSSANLQYVAITYDATLKQVTGCFNPASKSMLHNVNTKFDINGVDISAGVLCDTNAHKDVNPTSCFWCTR
jgi:prepilin-type N-terminal cleavage/methylation domain-containing protein